MTERRSTSELAHLIALWLILFAALAFRWAIANRGLDLTDESFALLASAHPEEVRVWASLFFYYTAYLFDLAGGDIATMRRLGILLVLLTAAGLARGTSTWLDREGTALKAPELFGVVALGSLAYYARGISVPNYNLLATCGLGLGFGLLLQSLPARRWGARFVLAGAGFALGVAVASKPPTIIALGAAVVGLVVSGGPIGGVGWLLGGVAAALAVPLAVHPMPEIANVLRAGVEFELLTGNGHSPTEALPRYVIQGLQLLGRAAAYAALPLAVEHLLRTRRAWFPRSLPLLVLLMVLAADDAVLGGRSAARSGRTAAAVLAAIVVAAAPSRARFAQMGHPHRRMVLVGALALPVIGLLGTDTNFSSAIVLFMGPWFLVVPVCLMKSEFSSTERLLRSAVPSLLAAVASTSAPYTSPYGLTAPFRTQVVPITLGRTPTFILTDRQTARFLGRLKEAAAECGFSPGDDIIGLMEMPGFVFALGGISPATAYYPPEGNALGTGARSAISFALSTVPQARLRRSFVLLNDQAIRLGNFEIAGKRIPNDYEVCFDRDGPSKTGDMRVRLLRPRTDAQP